MHKPTARDRLSLSLFITLTVTISGTLHFNKPQIVQVQAVEQPSAVEVIEPQAGQVVVTAPTPTARPVSENERIKNLIRETFGDNGELAIAIGMSESHLIPTRTLFASKGAHSWIDDSYKGECSVGLFMVNLASDNCEGKRVHYDKVPGNTLQDKIAWLKVPENNIKFAKKLYDERGNFTAWSGYTGGGYKKHMED